MNRSDSINLIAKALVKVQKAMGAAKKDAANPFFKSKYADLNAIREAVMPALNDNGITVMQNVNGETLETVLLHESGEFIGSSINIVVAKQNDPQAYGSALSYARRYSLQAMLCVGAEDDDGNKAQGAHDNRTTVTKKNSKPLAPSDDF